MGVLEGVNNIHDVRGSFFGVHTLAICTQSISVGCGASSCKSLHIEQEQNDYMYDLMTTR